MRPAILVVLAACGGTPAGSARPDARVVPDGSQGDVIQEPYRHTIAIEGVDDFTAGETFATTSASFSARIAWDDVNLYIGYAGPDLDTMTGDAPQKWLFVYLDTTTGGETQSEQYNTQRATFPTGFAADYYVRYKVNGTLTSLERNNGGTWATASPTPQVGQAGTFVELAIPLSSIGAGTSVGIVTYMINEKMFAEGTFAGLFSDNFVDGYATNMTLTRSYTADFTSGAEPAL
jgi:hypothetical protein